MRPNRRQFLATAGFAAIGLDRLARRLRAEAATAALNRLQDGASVKVTGIDKHEILLPYHQFNARTLFRYHGLGIQLRTIYVAKTNRVGLEGYGEAWGRGWPDEDVAKYVGTSPFDWIGDPTTLPINMAMYDLMGKYLGLPAWKLIGPRHRDHIPVAAWTVSQPPEQMAAEVQHAARQGYHWLKYHVDEIQNVVDQTEAMQAVAPPNFKIHFDFNANSTLEAIAPIVKKLEKYPVAGRIEDPITASDPDGWRKIKEMSSLPILAHHAPVDFMIQGICDGLMSGHAAVGAAAKTAAIAETTKTPIMLQNAGGTLNQAFLAHQAAVFKMATIDHVNLARLWKDDVTSEAMPIVDGRVRVPSGHGLGISLDLDKVRKYESVERPKQRPFLVRIRYSGGPTIYVRHDPERPGATDNLRFLNRLVGEPIPGPVPGYDNAVRSDFWDERDSQEFQRIWKATAAGPLTVE